MRFDELDLEDEILDGLEDMNFHEMTPVQEHTIPVILEGRDIIGCAQTGTGKTAAYTLPLLNKLLIEGNPDNVVKSVIIVPTRELAQQIDQQFQGFSYYLPVSTTVVYGGGDGKGWDVQKRGMLMGSDVVIATPGRMIAHLQNSGVDLSHVEYLILDEADRMLDMGFSDDIMKIVSYMPRERQTIMFSATLPPKIRELAKTILRNPAEVNIAISKPNEAIDQSAYICYESQKLGIIRELFAEPTDSKTIIFSSSKMKVKELAHTLKRMKLEVAAMHSDLEQPQREEVMLNFKNNKVKILVATTSWRAASTSRISAWSSTTTCRTIPRTTSTASAARRAPQRRAAPSHSSQRRSRASSTRSRSSSSARSARPTCRRVWVRARNTIPRLSPDAARGARPQQGR